MSSYLKSKQYYLDLYDKHTVDSCHKIEKNDTGKIETKLKK